MNEQEATAVLDRPRLKKLVIHRYRHVKPGTTLEFDDTWNVIVGKNGTGKTTLLKLIEAILRGDPTALDARTHVEFVIESSEVRIESEFEWKCSPPRDSLEVVRGEVDLRSRGTVTFFSRSDSYRWERAPYSGHHTEFSESTARIAGLAESIKTDSPPTLWPLKALPNAERLHHSRFDESLGFFEELLGWRSQRIASTGKVSVGAIGGSIPVGMWTQLAEGWPAFSEFGVVAEWARQPVTWGRETDAVLGAFEGLSGLDKVEFELRVQSSRSEDGEVEVVFHPAELKIQKGTSTFDAAGLSFGQKRLLAFLYYLQMNAPILILDELSNGFHRSWIDYAVEQMQTRQNFAATQNPLLLDRIFFHSPEELQRSLIFCREEDGKFVWENAKAEEIQEVYDAYNVGLENVSEILWRKGLW